MKLKLFVSLLTLVLYAALGTAQTCTPVTVSTVATIHDDGTGPVDNLAFGNWRFTFTPSFKSASITVQAGTWHFSSAINGWVNVRAGFGGCTLYSWTDVVAHSFSLHDLTTGQITTHSAASLEYTCSGRPASCAFNQGDPIGFGSYSATLQSGHRYQLLCNTSAAIFYVGASPIYTYILNVTVE